MIGPLSIIVLIDLGLNENYIIKRFLNKVRITASLKK